MIRLFLFAYGILIISILPGCKINKNPELTTGSWRAEVQREDSVQIIFNFEVKDFSGTKKIFIRNAGEAIALTDIIQKDDSLNFSMPAFESSFRTKIESNGALSGLWLKDIASGTQQWPFKAWPETAMRFENGSTPVNKNIQGRWKVDIIRSNGTTRPAIADFKQDGEKLTGSVLTPSGDYRYLDGIVRNDSLILSTFDGSHAFLLLATIENDSLITNGIFYSGIAGVEKWGAVKNEKAALPDVGNTPFMKDGFEKLNFKFPSIDGDSVSISDETFRDKVVVVQLMGSWCPNCMDETAFLSEYYKENKNKGVEVLGLAYEYTDNFQRSQKSLRKFQKKFDVEYPMLITGVTVGDSLKAEKTLPQLSFIKVYPTTIFIGRDGKVKKFHTGFYGPGSGEHYEIFKKEFNETIDALLKKETL